MKNKLSLSKKLIDTNNDQENFEPMKFQLQTDLSSSLKFRRNLSSTLRTHLSDLKFEIGCQAVVSVDTTIFQRQNKYFLHILLEA